tara:strand:+ start:3017 stop:3580 length:564 start_codon:yes stop_codon:yes gene_type:complete
MSAAQGMRYGGQVLGPALDNLLKAAGVIGTKATQTGMAAVRKGLGKKKNQVPAFLRDTLAGSANAPGPIPEAVGSLATLATGYKLVEAPLQGGMSAIGSMMGTNKQQSNYSQPMGSGMDRFIAQAELQNLKFQNELALMYAKQEASQPGRQYLNMAEAEKTLSEAGEITNAEVLQVARSIYGTGLRA